MSFRVNTNVSALASQRAMSKVNKETEESSVKLSSGQRITKAADDAAGLAISEKLKAEIRSSRQANRNANDGLSLVQVAEGGLEESSSLLTRMRELAIQAASDTLTDSDRMKSSMEYESIKDELERLSQTTEFNGKKLLNGSGPRLDFQVGVGDNTADDHISYDSKSINAGIQYLGVAHASIRTKSGAQQSLAAVDNAINKISGHRSLLGSIQNRLITSSNNLGIYTENMSKANSQIRDADFALETSQQARNSIVASAGTAVMAQANMSGQNALKLVE
ncbi:flagellin [Peredibacter sp. HCB2-198]|uniref:flagellin N-terminal helical domain-containing protein n=1 Tax=Peredibacter sp. HCB2-198 TaxID=3383025 RepID=UPI0038B5E242